MEDEKEGVEKKKDEVEKIDRLGKRKRMGWRWSNSQKERETTRKGTEEIIDKREGRD